VVVVSAPSGAGKSTVLARVLKEMDRLRFSVSHTTRPPRPGETEGVEYRFVDRATFERMRDAGLLLEWAVVHGYYYGTALAEYDTARREEVDLLLDLDVQGAAQVRVKLPDAVDVFILPPSYRDLERRLRGRGETDEGNIARRLRAAHEEASLYDEYDYVLVNDDLDECVDSFKAIIKAARARTSRVAPAAQAILATFEERQKEKE
jgi:guanylate kinase